MRLFFLLICLWCFSVQAQNQKYDSLRAVWNDEEQTVKNKLSAIHTLTWEHYLYTQPDSGFFYAELQFKFAQENEVTRYMAIARIMQGISLLIRSEHDRAMNYYNEGYKFAQECDDKQLMASAINNIGTIYLEQAIYDKAIEYYNQSLALRQEIGDKEGIAASYVNLGIVYYQQGDYKKANSNFLIGLKIFEETDNRRGIASTIGNMGNNYKEQGDYSNAILCLMRTLKIFEVINDRKGISGTFNNIGLNYELTGNLDSATYYYNKALKIKEETNDKQGIAISCNNLASIHYKKGDYGSSLNYFMRAFNLAKEVGAAVELRTSCLGLLRLHIVNNSMNEINEMSDLLRQLRLKDLALNFSILSELQKEMFFTKLQSDFDLLYDVAFHFPDLINQTEKVYDNTLLLKGLLLKSSTAMRHAILSSGDSLLTEKYNDWIALKRRIAKSYSAGKDISELEEQANELEKELVKGSQDFSDFQKSQSFTWRNVQSSLKDGESAIEFVRFTHYNDYRKDINKVQLYVALIIDSKCEHPTMVRLFEEPELEKILGTFPGNNLSYIEQVYGTKENTKSQLYDLIWKPMESYLEGTNKVFISPAGLLHKISFAALAKEQDVYLCDLYDIDIKSSTGKTVSPADGDDDIYINNIAIFGDINYNTDSTGTEIWNYLEGTKNEANHIEKILKKGKRSYSYYAQSDATENKFKEIASTSSILHIATHGYFYANPDQVDKQMIDEVESDQNITFRGGRSGMGVQTFVMSRNPLMRSGLAFAGANDVWSRSQIEGEDGVLTAAEIATLDLRNTHLVVLSACETGLGDIKGSEGVYGLQRSFKMAGVKYLIMSLWQVPDKETAEFMTTFYKYLIKTNNIKKSFSSAQMEMRKKYNPYYWAAFVLVE